MCDEYKWISQNDKILYTLVGEILQKVYPKSIRNKGLQVISSNNIGHKTKTICAL